MHSPLLKTRAALLAALLLAGVTGCGTSKSWLDRVWSDDDETHSEPLSPGAPSADDYLHDLDLLATGDPATQAEVFDDARYSATLTPGPSTNLRYALALATPGHGGTDLDQAQSLLRESLTQTALMTPSEIALANIYLESVEQQLTLESETRRLRESSVPRNDNTQERLLSQRLAAAESENRRLTSELAEAQQKLEAITSIERSIREQGQ